MNLSPEQQAAVATWLAAGATIADVQKRLREEFQVSLTYMDTRLLIDDLGLNLKVPAKPAPPPAALATPVKPPVAGAGAPAAETELVDDDEAFADAPGAEEFTAAPADAPAAAGPVKVEIDRLTRPGTVVSGAVTFGDGQSGKWALDQLGRLVFEGSTPGYRPSQADLQAFQRELNTQLQRHGY